MSSLDLVLLHTSNIKGFFNLFFQYPEFREKWYISEACHVDYVHICTSTTNVSMMNQNSNYRFRSDMWKLSLYFQQLGSMGDFGQNAIQMLQNSVQFNTFWRNISHELSPLLPLLIAYKTLCSFWISFSLQNLGVLFHIQNIRNVSSFKVIHTFSVVILGRYINFLNSFKTELLWQFVFMNNAAEIKVKLQCKHANRLWLGKFIN